MYQKIYGSWLHSKQDAKSIELLLTYEEYNKNIKQDLRTKVVKYVKNNRTMYGRALYKTRNCYADDITFSDFMVSVIETIDIKVMKELLTKSIDIIMQDKDIKKNYSRDDILKAIKVYSFYHVYIGYAFEQYIRDLIKSKTNYDVITSENLDKKYAIDMQVVDYKRGFAIGLQLKTHTFLNLSIDKRKEYAGRNRSAIIEKYCKNVYYVFHWYDGALVSNNYSALTRYDEACNSEDNFIILEDEEYFIEELHKAFERVENVEE